MVTFFLLPGAACGRCLTMLTSKPRPTCVCMSDGCHDDDDDDDDDDDGDVDVGAQNATIS